MASDDRIWTIEPDETGEVNVEELSYSLQECAGILRRVGGAFTIAARRRQVAEDVYLTESVVLGWSPHLPMVKRRKPVRYHAADDEARHLEEAGELADEELIDHFPEVEPEPVGSE